MQRRNTWFAAVALSTLGLAQAPATTAALSIDTDGERFLAFLTQGRARLLAMQHPSGAVLARPGASTAALDDQTGAMLAMLRLGHWQAAKAVLAFEFAAVARLGAVAASLPLGDVDLATLRPAHGWNELSVPPGRLAAMLVLQHYWYLRATRDTATIRRHWPLLEACVKRTPRQDGVLTRADASAGFAFADAALLLQAVFCLGGLQEQIDRIEHPERWRAGPPQPRPGAAWSGSALRLLQQLEQHFWRPDAGRFAAATTADAALLAAATADGLLPAWAGMLTTTGDKTTQHARAVLATMRLLDDRAPAELAMVVAALTQFDGAERLPALAELLRCDVDRLTAGDLGLAIDAALFAVTGLRCTAAPGVDEDWLRLRPELPPGARRLCLRHLAHGEFAGDLYLDEAAGRLRCSIDPHTVATPGGELLAVVHCRGEVVQTRLRAGAVFEHVGVSPQPLPALLAPPRFAAVADCDLAVLTRGSVSAERFAHPRTTWIDTAQRPRASELRQLLLADDRPTIPRLCLHCGWDDGIDAERAPLLHLLDAYQQCGGQVLRPRFQALGQQRLADRWLPLRANAAGALVPDVAATALRVDVELDAPWTGALLLGCGSGYLVLVDGVQRLQQGRAPLQPDRDAVPLSLGAGRHSIELQFLGGGSTATLLRWVDARGLPWQP